MAASVDYDGLDTISSELYDLDTEQSQARYDPRILSKELLGASQQHSDGSRENDGEERNGDGAQCINTNRRYEHGEKVSTNEQNNICISFYFPFFKYFFVLCLLIQKIKYFFR